MDIIVVSNGCRNCRRWQLGRPTLSVLALLVLVGAGALLYAGARYAPLFGASPPLLAAAPRSAEQLAEQRNQLDRALRASHEHLDALAARLAELQARMTRVDALGERLVDVAGLDRDEFAFDAPPPLGGPRPAVAQSMSVPDFIRELTELSRAMADRQAKLAAVEDLLSERKLRRAARPSGRPVAKGWISSGYGFRTDPGTGKRAFHEGVDFAGIRGTDVVAVAAGVVKYSGRKTGFGKLVAIKHPGGLVTRYAHNSELLVKVGQAVSKGQVIALMGSTGRSTGPHVHFEVLRDGRPLNPMKFVRAKG